MRESGCSTIIFIKIQQHSTTTITTYYGRAEAHLHLDPPPSGGISFSFPPGVTSTMAFSLSQLSRPGSTRHQPLQTKRTGHHYPTAQPTPVARNKARAGVVCDIKIQRYSFIQALGLETWSESVNFPPQGDPQTPKGRPEAPK